MSTNKLFFLTISLLANQYALSSSWGLSSDMQTEVISFIQNSVTPVALGAAWTASNFGDGDDRATFVTQAIGVALVPSLLSYKYPNNTFFKFMALAGGTVSGVLTYRYVTKVSRPNAAQGVQANTAFRQNNNNGY